MAHYEGFRKTCRRGVLGPVNGCYPDKTGLTLEYYLTTIFFTMI